MSFDISNLKTKVDLADGEWIDDIQDHPGLRLKVRSTNYKPFKVSAGGIYRRNSKLAQTDEGAVTLQPKLGASLAEHILIDWDMSEADSELALTDNGKPLIYSREVALAVLTADDAYGIGQTFRRAVEWAGDKVSERLLAKTKAASGN